MLGPLLAWLLLSRLGLDLRTLFLVVAPVSLAAVALALTVRERPAAPRPEREELPAGLPLPPRPLLALLPVLGIFGLSRASEAFLLLRAQDAGLAASAVPLLWAGHQAVKAAVSVPAGIVADRAGPARVLGASWLLHAAAFALLAFVSGAALVAAVVVLYGLHFALSEPAERALVAGLAPASGWGRAYGWFHLVSGFSLLGANLLFGALWHGWGSRAAFLAAATLAAAACALLPSALRATKE
jgi:MFS family permease